MAPSAPRAEAFAVKNGRFVAVGASADVRNLASARTPVIDAGGQTVTPGFIDAHCHVSGIDELFGVNTNVRTVKAVQDALRARAANTPPGQWVDGVMFDDTKLDDGPLHRRHLDEAVPNHPVNVAHRGGHIPSKNRLVVAGVMKSTCASNRITPRASTARKPLSVPRQLAQLPERISGAAAQCRGAFHWPRDGRCDAQKSRLFRWQMTHRVRWFRY
jgi:predicted amidohydrolase YtcJ